MHNKITSKFNQASDAEKIIERVKDKQNFSYFVGMWVGGPIALTIGGLNGWTTGTLILTCIVCAVIVGILWWRFRVSPYTAMATKKLNELLPPLSSSGKSQRKVIREAKQFIDKTRAETITLLVSNLQDLGVMRYSGLFLEGGRFDCYEGKVPPASRAAQISNRIKHVADNLKIDLKPYFVQGFTGGVCVHIDILGDPVYLG